jgi:hypothetical protein
MVLPMGSITLRCLIILWTANILMFISLQRVIGTVYLIRVRVEASNGHNGCARPRTILRTFDRLAVIQSILCHVHHPPSI